MKTRVILVVLAMLGMETIDSLADTHYVSLSGGSSAPYTSWGTAATNIQDAVDAASGGDTVLVTDGTYSTGSAEVYSMDNRVALTRAIELRSVNGPEQTIIQGAGPNGPTAVRCAYVTNGAVIVGFTLTGGHTDESAQWETEESGGGVWLDRGGIVSNCIVTGNAADSAGGGVWCHYGGMLNNCIISDNSSGTYGSGVYCYNGGVLNNCIISDNETGAYGGGGVCHSGGVFNHCTIGDNQANYGGGIWFYIAGGILNNCIVWGNAGSGGGHNWHESPTGIGSLTNACTTPTVGVNCVTNDPVFVNAGGGDYHLQTNSPCIDGGIVLAGITDDIEGTLRPLDGDDDQNALPDIGAYEFTFTQVAITNPADNIAVDGEISSIDVSGTCSEGVIGTLVWTNHANGVSGTRAAATMWSVVGIPLGFGANPITVSGSNAVGVTVSDSVTVTRSSEHGGTSLIHYASTTGSADWPFTSWNTAATTIQDAIEAAGVGDTVLVTDGTYSSGGAVAKAMSNRVALTKAVFLQSVNGPDVTVIAGAGPSDESAVRCAYLVEGAVLSGFTLTNGHTQAEGDDLYQRSGGGVLLDGGGIVSNCTINGNAATYYGGGVCFRIGGTLNRCLLSGSTAGLHGGGAFLWNGGTLNNSTVNGNTAVSQGGGAFCYQIGTLNHCTLSGNTATVSGGGVSFLLGGALNNCIVWGNSAAGSDDNWNEASTGDGTVTNACTTPAIGDNCVTGDPLFVNTGDGDYRLQTNSPCIDAGITLTSITDDMVGIHRPLNGDGIGAALPDIGAYEHVSALHDTDGDLQTDYEEYVADTDGTDSDDYLHILELQTGVPATVWFRTSAQRQYTLRYSTNLLEGAWTAVPGQVDVQGSGGQDSLMHTNSFPSVFYQVEVEMPQ